MPDPQPGDRWQQSADFGGNVIEVLAVNSSYVTILGPYEPRKRQWVWELWRTYMADAVLIERKN